MKESRQECTVSYVEAFAVYESIFCVFMRSLHKVRATNKWSWVMAGRPSALIHINCPPYIIKVIKSRKIR